MSKKLNKRKNDSSSQIPQRSQVTGTPAPPTLEGRTGRHRVLEQKPPREHCGLVKRWASVGTILRPNSRGPGHGGAPAPRACASFTSKNSTRFSLEKSPLMLLPGEGKRSRFEPRQSVCPNKASPSGPTALSELNSPGGKKVPSSTPAGRPVPPKRAENAEEHWRRPQSRGLGASKARDVTIGPRELPPTHARHHVANSPFATVPLNQYLLSTFQQKYKGKKRKKKTQFEETKQTSEPESDMTGMLDLSD